MAKGPQGRQRARLPGPESPTGGKWTIAESGISIPSQGTYQVTPNVRQLESNWRMAQTVAVNHRESRSSDRPDPRACQRANIPYFF